MVSVPLRGRTEALPGNPGLPRARGAPQDPPQRGDPPLGRAAPSRLPRAGPGRAARDLPAARQVRRGRSAAVPPGHSPCGGSPELRDRGRDEQQEEEEEGEEEKEQEEEAEQKPAAAPRARQRRRRVRRFLRPCGAGFPAQRFRPAAPRAKVPPGGCGAAPGAEGPGAARTSVSGTERSAPLHRHPPGPPLPAAARSDNGNSALSALTRKTRRT